MGVAKATACGGMVGCGVMGVAKATACGGMVGCGVMGVAAAIAVEAVARNVARTKRDFNEIKDMVALLPWSKRLNW
jgi:hypothetical protein